MTLQYPKDPGWKKTDTSLEAALSMKLPAKTIREKVYKLLQSQDLTTREISDILTLSYSSVQPRTSELNRQNKIFDSGKRRPCRVSNKSIIVWTTDAEKQVQRKKNNG